MGVTDRHSSRTHVNLPSGVAWEDEGQPRAWSTPSRVFRPLEGKILC